MIQYYISGMMTGKTGFNHAEFLAVEDDLNTYLTSTGSRNWLVVNPARNFGGVTDLARHVYLSKDIQQVLDSDVLVLIDGWEASPGARLEVDVARNTDKGFMLAKEITAAGGYSFTPIDPPDLNEIKAETTGFTVKDSGKRIEYPTGMVRDATEGKARFDLVMPKGIPYTDQMLTRWAMQMTRGADKYGIRNWEKASTEDEYERFKGSAQRHLMQWLCGERDEDHAAAVFFNVAAAEFVKGRLDA